MSTGATTQKTHPMVLVAAAALTVFSLLGSAAITGLLPDIHAADKARTEKVLIAPPGSGAGGIILDRHPGQEIRPKADDYKSKVQPRQTTNNGLACNTCGTIVSIQAVMLETELGSTGHETKGQSLLATLGFMKPGRDQYSFESEPATTAAYVIRVRMHNGSYRTITQYSLPQYAVGDQVKLESGILAISA